MRTLHEPNVRQPSPTALMRSAGQVPGAHERRGSALLIVIGTLALISVFAAIYVSIGRTDRRAATSIRTQKDLVDTSNSFGEYLSGVVGNDRLDAYVQLDGNTPPQAFGRRELTDAPYTDWTKRSAVPPGFEYQLFTPEGGPSSLNGINLLDDNSVASDSWLASTTPVYLGNPGTQGADRPFSQYEGYDPLYPNAKNFLDHRDWLQISNFAPDGRFVNLFNLRPNEALVPGTIGSFFAEPGLGTVTDADGRDVRRMSEHLSLWVKENPDDPESMIMTHVPEPANGNSIWVPGQKSPLAIGLTDPGNIPAVWTMYQRFMYMPINQPFITLNRNGDESTWADPDFPAYQYADADGDKFADSRWFELSSARDFGEDNNTSARDDVEVLYNNKNYRYFVAARAVDLSSMVNVNTATDLLVPPSSEFPMGLTPADIDLRRILTMQDAASDYTGDNNFVPLSFSQIHRPFAPPSPDANGRWDTPRPAIAYGRDPLDYRLYEHAYANPFGPPAPGTRDVRDLNDEAPSMLIGRYAYSALRRGIIDGGSLTSRYVGSTNGTAIAGMEPLKQYETMPFDLSFARITPEERYEQFNDVGRLNPSNRAAAWARRSGSGSGSLYGLDDLTELLSFRMFNDPEHTSRLERVMSGRYQSDNSDELQTRRMSPLLSNRPLELDRAQHGLAVTDLFTMNPSVRPGMVGEVNRDYESGRISFNSMAHGALSPRNWLTTISGSVALTGGEKLGSAVNPGALGFENSAPYIGNTLASPSLLFELYSEALAGELDADNDPTIWNMNLTDPLLELNPRTTLFYGHRSPELALRIAAHTSVNMKDMTDSDGTPTVATLILNGAGYGDTVRNYFTNVPGGGDPTIQPADDMYHRYPGAASGNLFDLDPLTTPPTPAADKRLDNGQLTGERQVVNVYGFEAMPVITEVSSVYVYTDADITEGGGVDEGGDQDYDQSPTVDFVSRRINYPPRANIGEITVNGDLGNDNSDYLIHVLAFQLHNPYDEAISLGGRDARGAALTRKMVSGTTDTIDPAANYRFGYYLEYAGRFYKVAEYLEHYPDNTIDPTYYNADNNDNITGNPSESGTTGGPMPADGSVSDYITRNVILGAGETRVFYVIADRRFDTTGRDARWELLDDNDDDAHTGNGFDGLPWTGAAEEWVQNQFRVGTSRPVMMMEFDPRDGGLLGEPSAAIATVENLATLPASPLLTSARNDVLEARLWRKVLGRGEESNDPAIPASERTLRNLMDNDLLVDRLSIDGTLDVQLAAAQNTIPDTVSFTPDIMDVLSVPSGTTIRNDNIGIVLTRWKTSRRRDYDNASLRDLNIKPEPGQITPWMLHSRRSPTDTEAINEVYISATPSASDIFDDNMGATDLSDPLVNPAIREDFEIGETISDFIRRGAIGNRAIVQTAALDPYQKFNPAGVGDEDAENDTATKFVLEPIANFSGSGLDHLLNDEMPEILISGRNIEEKPRLADLLLAWGIGPTYAPDPARTAAQETDYTASEWMTGPEAMAIAMGIEITPSVSDTDADSVWDETYVRTAGTKKPLLDDGHLVIDDFVSYLNVTPETPAEFIPGAPGVGDILRGTGVPTALGVIDQVRAIAGVTQLNEPQQNDPLLTDRDRQRMALSLATFGQVNINTAPIEVLRALPGLTPSRGSYDGTSGVTDEWWGKDPVINADLNLPDLNTLTGSSFRENPDVAAAIVAYRDRQYSVPNTAAFNIAYDLTPLNFEPTVPTLVSKNMRGEIPLSVTTIPGGNSPVDRASITGIDGLRSMPGFASLGELLAVRIDPASPTSRWGNHRHLSIQQYGFDDKYSGMHDIGGDNNTIMSQLFGYKGQTDPGDPSENMDDYAERLAMANSVLNTISVRSDYYAVWFLVHGYQESDVANLRPEDPLIPSVAKRYLMIVDRTNVIEPGDKPKILVLKEVPL